MPWLVWFLMGAGLGWWADLLFGGATLRNAFSPDPRLESPAAMPSPVMATPQVRQPSLASYVIFSSLLIVALFLAAGHYFDWIPWRIHAFEGFLVSPQIVALASGGVTGLLVSRYRKEIGSRSGDFYRALLGAEKSSWVLQAGVAIVVLFGVLLAFRPELAERLESIRAGEVEAKFSNLSATTRDTIHVGLSELARRGKVGQWIDFKEKFEEGTRANVLELDHSKIKEERTKIRNIVFENYIERLAVALACLEIDGRLERFAKSDDFASMVLEFRNRIFYQQKDGSGRYFGERHWKKLLESMDRQISKAISIIGEMPREISEKCSNFVDGNEAKNTITKELASDSDALRLRRELHARQLSVYVSEAVRKLEKEEDEKEYKLSYIDPYIVDAIGDLILLALGQTEKANFLLRVKSSYPAAMNFIQPGIINIHYQLTDAQLKSDATWPIEEMISELDHALDGIDYIIAEMRKKLNRADKTNYDPRPIIEVFFINKLAMISRYIEIYYQRALAGNPFTAEQKQKWISLYEQAGQNIGHPAGPVGLELNGIGGAPLSADDRAVWQKVSLPDPVLFELRVGLALSSILLTEKRGKAPAQACSIARFHLGVVKDNIQETGRRLKFDGPAELASLKGYLRQVGLRIDVAC